MKKNSEISVIVAGENAEEVITEIKQLISEKKTVILNLNKTENEQVQKNIIYFIKENYKNFVRKISEKVCVIIPEISYDNIKEGFFR